MDREKFGRSILDDFLKGTSCLSDEKRDNIITEKIEKDSSKSYSIVCVVEELAELQKELIKIIRNDGQIHDLTGLLEEMADVYISLSVIKLMYGIDDRTVWRAIDIKLREISGIRIGDCE